MTIKHIDVLSVARIAAVVYAALGFIGGLIFACISLLGVGVTAAQHDGQLAAFFSLLFGVGAIIALPILYGVFGFIGAAITTWLFNVAAGIAGGIRIQVES
ncbi:MAG TPA: hypothetical protein VL484_10360 [Vicinamibacterales bacterium]|jgi:hypothetical protein|nr:hypothetical protein [Vicinamibacterales bacterium]